MSEIIKSVGYVLQYYRMGYYVYTGNFSVSGIALGTEKYMANRVIFWDDASSINTTLSDILSKNLYRNFCLHRDSTWQWTRHKYE